MVERSKKTTMAMDGLVARQHAPVKELAIMDPFTAGVNQKIATKLYR